MAAAFEETPVFGREWIVVVWAAVMAAAIVWGLANTRLDLETQSAAALAGADIAADVIVEGRDLTVALADPSRRAEARALLEGIAGVRLVSFASSGAVSPARGVTSAPVPASAVPPAEPDGTGLERATAVPLTLPPEPVQSRLSARLDRGSFVIEGVVPSEEVATRITAVAELIYAPFFTNGLAVDPDADAAEWVGRAGEAIAVLPLVGSATLDIEGRRAVVTGVAATERRAGQLAAALQLALGDSAMVQPQISISGLSAPRFEGRTTPDGGVLIGGVVPSADIAAAISAAVAPRYGDGVVDEFIVDDTVEATFSLYRLPVALQLFLPFDGWEILIEGDHISGWLRGGASFASGSSELTPELEALLDVGAGILLRNPTLAMEIAGHTDDVGTLEANQQLSEERAQAAVDYLIAAGVARERLSAIGYGETVPVADNESTEGRTKNRRVEFSLMPVTRGGS